MQQAELETSTHSWTSSSAPAVSLCTGLVSSVGAVVFDDEDDEFELSSSDENRAPICAFCGVTALPSELSNVIDGGFVCDNADCEGFGEPVDG